MANLINYNEAAELFSAAGVDLKKDQYEKFLTYADFLAEKNAVMNLTAITEPREVMQKHFLDSVLPLRFYDIPNGSKVVDVGSGAGFPSVPMAIMRPDLRLTLIDSLNKRVKFLGELTSLLGIGAECVHLRAEDAGQGSYREKFDVAVARAVSRLPVLCEYCLPLVKVGGAFLALKGGSCGEEIDSAAHAIDVLGGKLGAAREYALPSGDARTLAVIGKVSPTPRAYPRAQAKISARELHMRLEDRGQRSEDRKSRQ